MLSTNHLYSKLAAVRGAIRRKQGRNGMPVVMPVENVGQSEHKGLALQLAGTLCVGMKKSGVRHNGIATGYLLTPEFSACKSMRSKNPLAV